MSSIELGLFNLLFNSIVSYLVGLALVCFTIFVFRVERRSLKYYLYSLPFAKLILDLCRGIPEDSYVYGNFDFFDPAVHGFMSAGLGFSNTGPMISLRIGVGEPHSPLRSVSLADVLHSWLKTKLGFDQFLPVVITLVAISCWLILRRSWGWIRFEQKRRTERNKAIFVKSVKVGFRDVDVYRSLGHSGSPFTGGVFKPYVCFPEGTFAKLSMVEREAALAHELSHVRTFDVLQTMLIQVLGDVFWFVPFYGWLRRRLEREREILADSSAVRSGADPLALAAVLVKLQEDASQLHTEGALSALAREPNLLRLRVTELLEDQKVANESVKKRMLRIAGALLATGMVLSSTFGTNARLQEPSPFERKMEAWVRNLFGIE